MFDLTKLFFGGYPYICFQNSSCVNSTINMTRHSSGHFSTLVQVHFTTVELSHFYVDLEQESMIFFFKAFSPREAFCLRLVFVMLIVHSKTLTKFNL